MCVLGTQQECHNNNIRKVPLRGSRFQKLSGEPILPTGVSIVSCCCCSAEPADDTTIGMEQRRRRRRRRRLCHGIQSILCTHIHHWPCIHKGRHTRSILKTRRIRTTQHTGAGENESENGVRTRVDTTKRGIHMRECVCVPWWYCFSLRIFFAVSCRLPNISRRLPPLASLARVCSHTEKQ